MGTRNLTCVMIGGEYRVAQYAQFDGYPEGQGATILEFLKNKFNRETFIDKLNQCYFIDEDKQSALWKEAGADGSGMVNMEVADTFKRSHVQLSRDMGGDVLEFIQNSTGEVMLVNTVDFAEDSLFCEWAYVVDLDKNVLEVYKGFNKEPVPDDNRFQGEPSSSSGTTYYPVKLSTVYKLDNLPSEETFLRDLDPDEIDEPLMTKDNVLVVIDHIRSDNCGDDLIKDRICNYMETNIDEFIECYEMVDAE